MPDLTAAFKAMRDAYVFADGIDSIDSTKQGSVQEMAEQFVSLVDGYLDADFLFQLKEPRICDRDPHIKATDADGEQLLDSQHVVSCFRVEVVALGTRSCSSNGEFIPRFDGRSEGHQCG